MPKDSFLKQRKFPVSTKKIGVVLNATPKDGGVFQYSRTVVKALSILDFKADIYYIYDDPIWHDCLIGKEGRLIKYTKLAPLNILGALLRRIDRTHKFGNHYKHFRPIYHKLNKIKIDLLLYPCPMPWAAEFDIPSIISIHDIEHQLHPEFSEVGDEKNRNIKEYLYNNICCRAKGILVDSKTGKNDIVTHYHVDPDKIAVLPFVPDEDLPTLQTIDVKQRFNLPNRYIFYPAQFWKHKNHVNLVRAISLIRDKYRIEVPVVFVGYPKNGYSELKGCIKELSLESLVYILGYISVQELASLYREAVALAMPTFFGPTNIPPLEAFILGCPVLTSKISAIPEQVGDAALLFDPYDFNEIAEKILLIWTDKNVRNQLIIKGKARSKMHSQENFSRILHSVIIETL